MAGLGVSTSSILRCHTKPPILLQHPNRRSVLPIEGNHICLAVNTQMRGHREYTTGHEQQTLLGDHAPALGDKKAGKGNILIMGVGD